MLAASAAFLTAGAPAYAGWAQPSDPSRLTCKKTWYPVESGLGRPCAVVTRNATGAWVQSMVQVKNTSMRYRSTYAWTWTIVAGREVSYTDCGRTTIAPDSELWCWGQTKAVSGHGKYVYGRGNFCILSVPGEECHQKMYSPLAYT